MSKRKKAGRSVLQRVHSGGSVTWLNLIEPSAVSLKELQKLYPFFLETDLRDCLPPFERPKMLVRDEYLFLVLLFPILDEKASTILPYEVDFFLGKDFLVTSHRGMHPTLNSLADACSAGSDACAIRPNDTPVRLMLDVIHGLTTANFPMVTELSNRLIETERRLFDDSDDGDVTRSMLHLRTNIVGFRKAMQGNDNVLRKLLARGEKFFPPETVRASVDDINGHSSEIRDFLENDKDTIDALYDAHLSLVTYRTNQATKTLTALAFIVFPMTLVAAIFSMRAVHMPFVGSRDDFWLMLGVMFGVMLVTVAYIKSRRWL